MGSFCSSLLAVAASDRPVPEVGSQVWGGGGYMALMALLFLLFALMVAAFLFFKRVGLPNTKKTGELELLETRPLGGRQFIVVGKYGDERFLLGVCPGTIKFLCRLNGEQYSAASLMEDFPPENDDEA